MTIFELFVLAVGLSMDAFAVAVCKGLAIGKIQWKHVVIVGLWFGGFQALMPLIGYLLGSSFAEYIAAVDHWIAMILLVLIGANMVRESLDKDPEHVNPSLGFKTMLVMAIATSIDALAVGVTFAFLEVRILPAVSFIGVITFLLSALGVKIGSIFGTRYKSKAELAGGVILILLGIKILLEHLGSISEMQQCFQDAATHGQGLVGGTEAVLRPAAGVHVATFHTLMDLDALWQDAAQGTADQAADRLLIHIGHDLINSHLVPDGAERVEDPGFGSADDPLYGVPTYITRYACVGRG